MIARDEIDQASVDLGVHTSHVQRDYVFGWLLCGIFSQSELGKQLVLKGGNCLRKGYFPFGRFSGDLDFSSPRKIPTDWLAAELNRVCEFVRGIAGVEFDTSRTISRAKRGADDETEIVEARVYFRDFYGRESSMIISVRIDVTEWERLYLPVQSRRLIHAYSDYEQCQAEIRCVKLEEQLASKMKCLLQRRHVPDLFDLIYSSVIHPDFAVNRTEIVSTFLRKTIFHASPGIAKGLFLDLPLLAFQSLWEKYIVCPLRSRIDFGNVGTAFKQFIADLFANISVSQRQVEFFPSSLRNPIMEAGHTLTLLDIVYKGTRRTVEPYSLTYRKRKDGVAQEYFYVYDLTGGSSGPGIKSFVASNVQRVENTNKSFEPRFPVEITKAGDVTESLYSEGRSSSRYWSGSADYRYFVACPLCEKRFRRKSYDVHLKPHKDKYGNRCLGKTGYMT
ncbi:MAG: nucleotidyl transferase AbiEii/AbiGii toxin family protein [Tepidisphaeraceae bacterium]|jgi:predicted nucleotidyltransferase component of viral defense system